MISMGSDSHGYEKTRTGRDYSIGTAPGYEGAGALPDYIHETQLSTKTLHDMGEGLHRKKDESAFEDGSFGTPLTLIIENGKKDYSCINKCFSPCSFLFQ